MTPAEASRIRIGDRIIYDIGGDRNPELSYPGTVVHMDTDHIKVLYDHETDPLAHPHRRDGYPYISWLYSQDSNPFDLDAIS